MLFLKNCNNKGYVQVFLNNKPTTAIFTHPSDLLEIANSKYNQSEGKTFRTKTMLTQFVVKPGDVLKLKEEDGATIKVLSLSIGRG